MLVEVGSASFGAGTPVLRAELVPRLNTSSVRAIQERYPAVDCAIYTGDEFTDAAQVVNRVKAGS